MLPNRGLLPRLAGPWTQLHTAKGTVYYAYTYTVICILYTHSKRCVPRMHSVSHSFVFFDNLLTSGLFLRSRSVSGASTGLSSSPLSSPRVRACWPSLNKLFTHNCCYFDYLHLHTPAHIFEHDASMRYKVLNFQHSFVLTPPSPL